MLNEDDFRDMMPDSREVYENFSMEEKQDKPVMAKLVKVLEDNPKGVTVAELQMTGEVRMDEVKAFEIPQGPARIGSQWW